jgi:hypothetical protein
MRGGSVVIGGCTNGDKLFRSLMRISVLGVGS